MPKKSLTKNNLTFYSALLTDIKARISEGQTRAIWAASTAMLATYWDVGRILSERQSEEGWGASVLPRLEKDLRNDLSEIKGFSARNMRLMTQFYKEYHDVSLIWQQPVAKLPASQKWQHLVAKIPWSHNVILMQKIKGRETRLWYMQQILEQGWGRNTLTLMIKSQVHKRQGKASSNFKLRLPEPQSDLAQQMLKDPYVFDFATIAEPFKERELETNLVKHLEKFLIELGQGFAFVGRQYHIEVSDNDFYIDLLFYHLKLRAYVVIELKKGPFKPDYAGKMNFYCSVVDDKLRSKQDNPTIGLILCQDRNRILAEYALRDINKPIGVSDYELTQNLPTKLKSSLPSIKQIEKELSVGKSTVKTKKKK